MNRFSAIFVRASTRFYCTQTAKKAKSPLAILRQKTGLPIGKCREALTKHNEDLEAAESWLYSEAQKEGWAKVEKLKDRTAHQGLIGMLIKRSSNQNQAIMLEVNCETDFVAKNDKFKELASTITLTTFHHKSANLLQSTPIPVVDYLSKDLISSIPASSEQTLADKVAENVGQLGENISISRGCLMCASQGLISGFVYNNVTPNSSEVQLGTYGALLHMLPSEDSESPSEEHLQILGQQICQHIVGMDVSDVTSGKDLIGVLLEQSFLFDNSVTVGELVDRNKVSITKIIRYALGETDTLF